MKTIEIKLYEFEELSEEAKQNAINNHRENVFIDYIYDESFQSVKAFNEIFSLDQGSRSWLEYQEDYDFNIRELSGLRLRKYIINNFYDDIFEGKYYGKLVNTFKNGKPIPKSKEHPAGLRHVVRHSKAITENCCVLTGVCYDDTLLKPIYDFIEYKPENRTEYENTSIIDLFDSCFDNLRQDIESEVDYRNSDEGIIEDIDSQAIEFTENGDVF